MGTLLEMVRPWQIVKLQQNSLGRLVTVGTPEEGEEQRGTGSVGAWEGFDGKGGRHTCGTVVQRGPWGGASPRVIPETTAPL